MDITDNTAIHTIDNTDNTHCRQYITEITDNTAIHTTDNTHCRQYITDITDNTAIHIIDNTAIHTIYKVHYIPKVQCTIHP